MDKVFSVRVDEAVIRQIGALARQLCTSRRRVIEDAVRVYAAAIDEAGQSDVFERTSGAWRRRTPVDQTVEQARRAFRERSKNR